MATDRFHPARPSQALAWMTVGTWLLFAAIYVSYVLSTVEGLDLAIHTRILLVGKTALELVASLYGLAFFLGALTYVIMREPSPRALHAPALSPPVGIVYLCCDDADAIALESLARVQYPGRVTLVVQDDSRTVAGRAELDHHVRRLRHHVDWDIRVLRRPDRQGGKPAAVNYVLSETGDLYDYFLLCDNDSIVLDPDTIQRAVDRFADDEAIAVVQCRTVHVPDGRYCPTNALLAQSISAFHAFLAPAARYGWMPFIGHNAFLQTAAVRAVGGMTPGFFSDDLDLTVRLNLQGYRVAYAPEIEMGEIHPPSYTAFRTRSYKWAYGCIQSLRAHWKAVLTSPQFSFAAKFSFFQFTGFYLLQSLLFVYLTFVLLAIPLGALGVFTMSFLPSVMVGLILVGLVYAPLLAYYLKARGKNRGWPKALVLCGLVYGGTDFSVVRGIVDAFTGRRTRWVPTNQVGAASLEGVTFLEAAFGLTLLVVPTLEFPELLYLPCWYLFAGKFLFGPPLARLYQDSV